MKLYSCETCGGPTTHATCADCREFLSYGADDCKHNRSVDLLAGEALYDHHELALVGRYARRHEDPFAGPEEPIKWLTDAAIARARALQMELRGPEQEAQMDLFVSSYLKTTEEQKYGEA